MRRFFQNNDGTSAVEFALIAPLFIFFMMAIIDLARFSLLADSIETGVLEGARAAMVSSDNSAQPASVSSISGIVTGASRVPDPAALSVSVTWQGNSNTVGSVVTVTASYDFDYMTPEFFMSFAPQTITKTRSLIIVT